MRRTIEDKIKKIDAKIAVLNEDKHKLMRLLAVYDEENAPPVTTKQKL